MGGYIGNAVTSQSADSTIYLPVRQTALVGSQTAAAVPNFMAAGTGLRVALSATATPMVIAFATGFGAYGASDLVSRLSANVSDMTGADLATQVTSYIFATYTNNAAVIWGSTANPPQYGYTYQQNQQSLLRFAGADASTSIIDDYGNTWAAVGNAQVDTAVQIDTLNTLLLDGTGDYVESTSFTSLGGGSWTMEAKVRWNTLPTAATTQVIFNFGQTATNFGVLLGLNNTAGTTKTTLSLSSNSTSADIASVSLGTSTVWATATTYHIAVTYDAVAGKYFVYKDGIQDNSVTSALRISGLGKARIGETIDATLAQLNGAVAGFRLAPFCRYPNGTTFVAPTLSAFAVEGHWFDIGGYQMWEATTASAVAGTNPTFTVRVRCFVGEVDTSAAAVTAVRNYAYQGKFSSALVAPFPGVSTQTSITHNLGVLPIGLMDVILECVTSEQGYVTGDQVRLGASGNAGFAAPFVSRTTKTSMSFAIQNTSSISVPPATGGANVSLTVAKWGYRINTNRGW